MKSKTIRSIFKYLNLIILAAITSVLILVFAYQFIFNELPCPLCLLQRIGLLAMAFGFMLNIRYEIRPSHYALSLLASVITAMISLRQIVLHFSLGDAGYGSEILGMHMYSWLFIVCIVAIIYISIALSISGQYRIYNDTEKVVEIDSKFGKNLTSLVFVLFFLVIAFNIGILYLQCGLTACAENPTVYKMLV